MAARPASRRSERRTAARADRRAAARQGPVIRRVAIPQAPALIRALWWSTALLLFVTLLIGLLRKITWYLAVDQFGYLTFAHDLLHGRVFHHWPPLEALVGRLPRRVDILAQTYVAEGTRAYCRYPPGFPILLAGWIRLFGDDGAHYLNPTVFVALLATLLVLGRRVFRSRWRALIAVALVTLFPTYIHLWAITPTRDLSAHLAGFLGITLLLPAGGRLVPRRVAAAGVALGYALVIRPDAVVYAIPASALFALRWFRARPRGRAAGQLIGAAILGVLVGVTPLLAYDWMATGNPFRLTQGMELERFFDRGAPGVLMPPPPERDTKIGYPPPGWHGGTLSAVQGGGLRLGNFPKTFPGNLRMLRMAYSDLLLGLAVLGAILALFQRRALFVVAVPYVLVGLFFFSCWARPDGRYLSGVFCMIPLLIVEGTFGLVDMSRKLAGWRRVNRGRQIPVAAAAALAGAFLAVVVPPNGALPTVVWMLVGATLLSLLAGATWPGRRVVGVTGPVIAVALVVLAMQRGQANSPLRAGFQRPEMVRARTTFARVVEPRSVVITTEDVGRPAENIEYYSGVAWALYLTDLERWGVGLDEAAERFAHAGFHPYLLLPPAAPGHRETLQHLERTFNVERVAAIAPNEAMDYFVAAPFHHGVAMELTRLTLRQ